MWIRHVLVPTITDKEEHLIKLKEYVSTLKNVEKVWEAYEKMGYAANNIFFGVGAFCFHALFDPTNKFTVLTRDTWGMAMKATHGVFGGKEVPIYKDPKTDQGGLKKSHKGCCAIKRMDDGNFQCFDGHKEWVPNDKTDLRTVFENSVLENADYFQTIRKRLYPEVA